jgi:hypothetical protein
MLKGSKPAVVKKIQPVSIHGQISLDVYVYDPDDPQGQVSLARIGPESVPKNLEPGDPVEPSLPARGSNANHPAQLARLVNAQESL